MTAWEGDLLGRDIISGIDNYCRLKKIVCKIFSTVLENAKSFSERFFKQFVCPSINPQIRIFFLNVNIVYERLL